jgi:hypothetical protein
MKKLGQFCAMAVLVLSIAATSYAGHIDCGDAGEIAQPTTAGHIDCPAITDVLLIMLEVI